MNLSHLAAMHRKRLSSTAKLIIDDRLLSPEETLLDYGCGRGFDFQKMRELGYNTVGWDPYYFPDTKLEPVDMVMFSYVLNVLTDPNERRDTLLKAWSLAQKQMVVAALVRGPGQTHQGKITKIGTYAKDWCTIELRGFIESNLGYEAIRLDKDKFLVKRDGSPVKPMHCEEVLSRIDAIAQSGWVAPWQTIIKRYYSNLGYRPQHNTEEHAQWKSESAHYRLICRQKWLPGKKGQNVRVIHLRGGLEGEHAQWAIEGLKRRNRIAELKFRCIEQSFLHEFAGFKDFSFLDTEQVKIYS